MIVTISIKIDCDVWINQRIICNVIRNHTRNKKMFWVRNELKNIKFLRRCIACSSASYTSNIDFPSHNQRIELHRKQRSTPETN
jgi:hypothetical protein